MHSDKTPSISACLVVYNEGKIIERCLESIRPLVDEIILVHDGECQDDTLKIARKYTDKIFVRPHAGMMEAHLVFAFKQASSDWILRIDADEYFDVRDLDAIKKFTADSSTDSLIFKWELWDGEKNIYFRNLQKMVLFRKDKFHYIGVPHEQGWVDNSAAIKKTNIFLHHQPLSSNVSWVNFLKKTKKWVPIHAHYFFPELVVYESFNTSSDTWLAYISKVKKHAVLYAVLYPVKVFLAQLKNGFFSGPSAWNFALQHAVYHFWLYFLVFKMKQKITTSGNANNFITKV